MHMSTASTRALWHELPQQVLEVRGCAHADQGATVEVPHLVSDAIKFEPANRVKLQPLY